VTGAPTDRSHLSIGEVLSLLQDDFPDVTISKIRFLEAQGLLDPERTPSGYRKFYESDVETLRWILRQQKENYLPLKVIKDRLDETGPIRTAPTAAGHGAGGDPSPGAAPTGVAADDTADDTAPGTATSERRNGLAAAAHDDRPGPEAPSASGAESPVAGTPPAPPVGDDPTLQLPTVAGSSPSTARRPRPKPSGDGATVSLTAEELAQASGLSQRAVRELEGYGLLSTHIVGDASFYDADALVIARTAAGFLEHGIEARHIRGYKVAADREAALYEQIILPLLKQRNPDARRRAEQTVAELVRLGDEMRGVLLRRGLRDHLPPR
jgi:DNA-binding transcriptional MerR regulator